METQRHRCRHHRASSRRRARLAVDVRQDDAADQPLGRPPLVHERDGEPVEQFRVSRRFAADAEVARGRRRVPRPKSLPQTRFTQTRAVSGLSRLAIAWASSSRPLPVWNGCGSPAVRQVRKCRVTSGPGRAGVAAEKDVLRRRRRRIGEHARGRRRAASRCCSRDTP